MFLGNIMNVVRKKDKDNPGGKKKAITKRWLKPDPANQEDWIRIVEEISIMEKMTILDWKEAGMTTVGKNSKWYTQHCKYSLLINECLIVKYC